MIKNPFRRIAQSPQIRNSILGPMALIATTNSGVGFSVLVWGDLAERVYWLEGMLRMCSVRKP